MKYLKKLKKYLFEKLLPDWCRRELLSDLEHLEKKLTEKDEEITRLNIFIDGMENALRRSKRIILKVEGGAVHGED